MTKVFLCLLILAGFHAHAASLSDVNKLVELLNHQLQQTRDVEEPIVSPVRALPVAPAQSETPVIRQLPPGPPGLQTVHGSMGMRDMSGMPEQPAVLPDMPMMPTMPETEYYGMMGHEKCTTYIRDLFEDMYRIPVGEDMIDNITYDPKYAQPLVTVLDRLRDVEDREGVILMTVRRFVETMLRDRLRCPSTVLERYIMAYMKREEGKLLMNTDSMFSALVPVLSDIPHIRATNISIEMLARLISRETHGHVFNETMDEIMTWTMGDVIGVAEHLRIFLREHYAELMNMPVTSIPTMLESFLTHAISLIYCPSIYEVGYRHAHAFYELRNGLMEMEREELCYVVEEFLERYVPEPSLHGENETTYRTVMETTCDIVGGYIKELVVRLEKLEMSIRKDEGPTEFLTMIRPYFEKVEIEMLMTVLERVGWPMTEPKQPSLMIADVIAHEEKDMEHWTNLIENLTPEMFEAMTFEEFISMVENWLNEKYGRIDTYKEFQRLEPGY